MNVSQIIVRVVCIKGMYKTSDFCKLSNRMSLFCNMWYAMHRKESAEAVINRKLHTPKEKFMFDIASMRYLLMGKCCMIEMIF